MALGLPRGGWAAGLAIMTAGTLAAQAVPAQLGVSEPEAQQGFLGSVVSGYPQWGAAGAAFVALPTAARVAVVQGGFAWARAYTKSQVFRAGYEQSRQNTKPVPPEIEGTVDEELARQLADQRKSLEETKKALTSLPADQRKAMEELFKQTEAQLKDPEYLAMLRTGIEGDRASRMETYQSNVRDWEETWPAKPETLVARRLQTFLTECGDVDFAARLQERQRTMVFVNPEYEQKSANWKICYRAGAEAVGAARTAAKAWLEELSKT